MARRGERPTRQEVSEKVDRGAEEMKKKESEVLVITGDFETVREIFEKLDFSGTAEGTDSVETSLKGAEQVTEREFEREDEALDQRQQETQEYAGEIEQKKGSVEGDLEKLSEASAKVETEPTVNELVKAKEGAIKDIEFLDGRLERAREAREKSELIQKELQARLRAGKRS